MWVTGSPDPCEECGSTENVVRWHADADWPVYSRIASLCPDCVKVAEEERAAAWVAYLREHPETFEQLHAEDVEYFKRRIAEEDAVRNDPGQAGTEG